MDSRLDTKAAIRAGIIIGAVFMMRKMGSSEPSAGAAPGLRHA